MVKRFAFTGATHKLYVCVCVCIDVSVDIIDTKIAIKSNKVWYVMWHTSIPTHTHMTYKYLKYLCNNLVVIQVIYPTIDEPKIRIQFSIAWTFEYEL